MFAPIIERSIEGRHSEVNRGTPHTRHHNGAYISCRLRLKELVAHSSAKPAVMQEVQELLSTVRVATWTLRHLNLRYHPAVRDLTGDVPESVLDKVVYRLDAATQFSDFRQAVVDDDLGPDPCARLPSLLGDESGIMRWAALDHFRDTFDSSDWLAAAQPHHQ